MFRYLVRRTLWAIVLFLIIMFVTFVIFFMAPNNPARAVCGGDQARPACLELATEKLGLDKPITSQYGRFINKSTADRLLAGGRRTSRSRVSARIRDE